MEEKLRERRKMMLTMLILSGITMIVGIAAEYFLKRAAVGICDFTGRGIWLFSEKGYLSGNADAMGFVKAASAALRRIIALCLLMLLFAFTVYGKIFSFIAVPYSAFILGGILYSEHSLSLRFSATAAISGIMILLLCRFFADLSVYGCEVAHNAPKSVKAFLKNKKIRAVTLSALVCVGKIGAAVLVYLLLSKF